MPKPSYAILLQRCDDLKEKVHDLEVEIKHQMQIDQINTTNRFTDNEEHIALSVEKIKGHDKIINTIAAVITLAFLSGLLKIFGL